MRKRDGRDDVQQMATGWSWTLGQRGQSLCTSGASTIFIAILQICFHSVAKRTLHMRTWIWNVCVCVIVRLQMHSNKICAAFFLFFFLLQSSYSLFIKHPNEGIHREIYCGNSELRSHQQRSTKWLDDPQRVIMWNRAYWSNGPEYPETAPTMDAAHSCSPRMSDSLIERFERRKKKQPERNVGL